MIARIERLNEIKVQLRTKAQERAELRAYDEEGTDSIQEGSLAVEVDYLYLDGLDSVSNIIHPLKRKKEGVKNRYMRTFSEYYVIELIRQSVNNRNGDMKRRCRNASTVCGLLSVEDAVNRWELQGGRCDSCEEAMNWSRALDGKGSYPEIDRVDVSKGTYVENVVWLCSYCNQLKGVRVELMKYDELLLDTLLDVEAVVGKSSVSPTEIACIERRLDKEIERQSSRRGCR